MSIAGQKITEEQIVAYVDGELAGEEERQVAASIAADPTLAASAEEYRGIRELLSGAYAPISQEPVPERFLDSVAAAASNIVRLPLKAFSKAPDPAPRSGFAKRAMPIWAMPLAATLLVGFLAGQFWLGGGSFSPAPANPAGYVTAADGSLVAQAHLASALNNQLSGSGVTGGETPAAAVALTFRSREGNLCRVFNLRDAGAAPMAGVACRGNAVWRVTALAPMVSGGASGGPAMAGDYQPAGAVALPAAVNAAIADSIAGDPLGADQEAAALDNGWR